MRAARNEIMPSEIQQSAVVGNGFEKEE